MPPKKVSSTQRARSQGGKTSESGKGRGKGVPKPPEDPACQPPRADPLGSPPPAPVPSADPHGVPPPPPPAPGHLAVPGVPADPHDPSATGSGTGDPSASGSGSGSAKKKTLQERYRSQGHPVP